MNFKMILRIQSQALLTFAATLLLPIAYALIEFGELEKAIFFAAIGIFSVVTGIIFQKFGVGRFQRAPIAESAAAILLMYPLLAIFGCLPFLLTNQLELLDALLETVGDLTSAGLSLLPPDAPYILRLWQSCLMWLGSLLFLIMLVTVLPEVSGCFGITLSLQGGQGFSAVIGQMNLMSIRVIKVYSTLTATSFLAFKLAGLGSWDALLMAMRCISTGGGDFFPAQENIYVEYAAIFAMLLACGNFLLYYRVIYNLLPPRVELAKNYFTRLKQYFSRFKRTIIANAKMIFANEEMLVLYATIFFGTLLLLFRVFSEGLYLDDGNEAFRESLFYVVSFVSTTGIVLDDSAGAAHPFDKFFIFLMAVTGGCIGSVTGGFKIIRLIVLIKITAAEVRKTIHPRMMTAIRVGDLPVPIQTCGRILSFFFLALLTMFICAAVLSFTGATFSEAVAMSIVCLSNVGILPGLCDAETFRTLSAAGKIFCMMILIVGRLEIFALLIAVAGLKFKRKKSNW